MTDEFAIDGVLRSLPPSFKNYVRDYVMGRDSITFCEFVSRLRHVKVEPIEGEVVSHPENSSLILVMFSHA